MGKPLAVVKNQAEGMVIGGSPASAVFLPKQLANWRVGKVAKLTASAGYFTFSTITEPLVSIWWVLYHNLAAGQTIELQGSDLDPVAGPWNTVASHVSAGPDRNHWARFTQASYLHWRVNIPGGGPQVDPVRIGELGIGLPLVFSRNFAWGSGGEGYAAFNKRVETDYGTRVAGLHFGEARKWIGQMASGLTAAELAEVVLLYKQAKGSALPFLWVPDQTVSDVCAICHLQDDEVTPQPIGPGRWGGVPLNVVEDPFGRVAA